MLWLIGSDSVLMIVGSHTIAGLWPIAFADDCKRLHMSSHTIAGLWPIVGQLENICLNVFYPNCKKTIYIFLLAGG